MRPIDDIVIIKNDELKISVCKYYLPCGWCELKQNECGQYFAMMYSRNYTNSGTKNERGEE